ncbi:hypothetical protein UZ36_07775 [Candidatus Nitromaritima sp. SCGC AAA799-C22]|nr:hypothetical protein UZ36_07775 [Candidatus Nitromaritima sp. SCGC AAA799-C22]
MKCLNVGPIDRVLRILLGAMLIGLGVYNLPDTLGTVLGFIGLIPLVTGVVGVCPVYSLFKINTCLAKKDLKV